MKKSIKRFVAIAFVVLTMMLSLVSTATAVYIPRVQPSGSTGSYTFHAQAQSSFFSPKIILKQQKCSYAFVNRRNKKKIVKYYPHYEITVVDKTTGKTHRTTWKDGGIKLNLKRNHYYEVTVRYSSYIVDTLRGLNPNWTLQSSTSPCWWMESSAHVVLS